MVVHWTIVDEIRLLRWASEFKPAGIHKHFHMFCIVERMNSPDKYPVTLLQKETMKLGKVFTAKDIWDKLSQSYNLEKIDEMENTYSLKTTTEGSRNGDGNDDDGEINKETLLELNNRIRVHKQDFTLPWEEYGELILENARKSPNSNEEQTQIEDRDGKDNTTPKKSLSGGLQNEENNEENNEEKNVAIKVKELSECHTEENDSPMDSQRELTAEVQSDEKELQREYASDEEQKTKTTSKTTAPVRKSRRLKRNKEVKFEDEEREEKKEEDTKEEERKEKKEEIQKVKENANEEIGKENNENEEGDDEREKSTSYENTNGSESEEVDEGLEYESEREIEGTGKEPESEGDNLKKKIENKKDSKDKNEPLAKRTRHSSSAGNTSNETSPKRKRRKAGSRKNSPPATRVSSRLRNKK